MILFHTFLVYIIYLHAFSELFTHGKCFLVFLDDADKGSEAMFMPRITWIDQEVILVQPKFFGTFRGNVVLQLTNPFVPIRSILKIGDDSSLTCGFPNEVVEKIAVNRFTVETGVQDRSFLTFRFEKIN